MQQIVEIRARMAELDPASVSISDWIELYSEIDDLEQHLADCEDGSQRRLRVRGWLGCLIVAATFIVALAVVGKIAASFVGVKL